MVSVGSGGGAPSEVQGQIIGQRSSSACYPEMPQERLPCLIWKLTFRFRLTSHNALSIGTSVGMAYPRDALLEMLCKGPLNP